MYGCYSVLKIRGIDMLRKLIQYFRSCFCNHDWEHLNSVNIFENNYSERPYVHKEIYRCKKCGYVQKIKY